MVYLILILFVVWAFSFFLSAQVMIKKGIEVGFWSLLCVLLPIANTVVVIVYFRPKIDFGQSFTEFWKQLNEK